MKSVTDTCSEGPLTTAIMSLGKRSRFSDTLALNFCLLLILSCLELRSAASFVICQVKKHGDSQRHRKAVLNLQTATLLFQRFITLWKHVCISLTHLYQSFYKNCLKFQLGCKLQLSALLSFRRTAVNSSWENSPSRVQENPSSCRGRATPLMELFHCICGKSYHNLTRQ